MAAWSETSGTKVVANIIPTSPNDLYPTHHDIFGRGGYKAVKSIEERNAIKISRLTLGAEVRETTPDGNSTVYYVSKMPDNIKDTMTGADCEWAEVKSGGFDEEALAALKGQPNGLASLDEEGKVPESQTRTIIFRGTYVNENEFKSVNGTPHVGRENAIYIDNTNGKMYSFTGGKFVRDSIYWNVIS